MLFHHSPRVADASCGRRHLTPRRLWRAADVKNIATITSSSSEGSFVSVALSACGTRAAIAREYDRLYVDVFELPPPSSSGNVKPTRLRRCLFNKLDSVCYDGVGIAGIAFHPLQRDVAYVLEVAGHVRILDLARDRFRTLPGGGRAFRGRIAINRAGTVLATVGLTPTVTVIDACHPGVDKEAAETATLGVVESIALSARGEFAVLSCGTSTHALVVDPSGAMRRRISNRCDSTSAFATAMHPSDRWFCSTQNKEGEVAGFDVASGKKMTSVRAFKKSVEGVVISPCGSKLAVLTTEKMKVFDVGHDAVGGEVGEFGVALGKAAFFDRMGRRIAFCNKEGSVVVADLAKKTHEVICSSAGATVFAADVDERRFAAIGDVWNVSTPNGKWSRPNEGTNTYYDAVVAAAFVQDGTLVACRRDGIVRAYKLTSDSPQEIARTFVAGLVAPLVVTTSLDKRIVAVGAEGGQFLIAEWVPATI